LPVVVRGLTTSLITLCNHGASQTSLGDSSASSLRPFAIAPEYSAASGRETGALVVAGIDEFVRTLTTSPRPFSRETRPLTAAHPCTMVPRVPGPREDHPSAKETANMNDRAREILAYIQRYSRERGYPPTIREIGREFAIASTNGVRYYFTLLEKAGHLKRKGKISRGIETMPSARSAARGIPILGRVAAGQPILAEESLDGSLEMSEVFGDISSLFALRVRGDSMIEAGIHDGDYVIVRQQERADPGAMVVALIEDEATVKYYQPRRDRVELRPANAKYKPIAVEPDASFRILGVVRGVIRTVK
jgi:repressor LexA